MKVYWITQYNYIGGADWFLKRRQFILLAKRSSEQINFDRIFSRTDTKIQSIARNAFLNLKDFQDTVKVKKTYLEFIYD